jgi:signal transduction histidine kinase
MLSPQRFFGSRRGLSLGLGLALSVLAVTILWSTWRLRQHIRAQIPMRDGETLDAVAEMQYLADKSEDETITTLEDPAEQIQLVLKISRLRNVLAVRLFSPEGDFVTAVPAYITESSLTPEEMVTLRGLQPVSHYFPKAQLQEQVLMAQTNSGPVPLLEVNIPLREPGRQQLAGIAQFLINGSSIAGEYAQVNRALALQSVLAFALGGSILAVGLTLAFHKVQRANQLLADRTANLLQANRALALTAKISAVGAVTSHLIHGLKNPLTGLQSFVREQACGQGQDSDWQVAIATTKRMEDLINRVVRVLQEDQDAVSYEISVDELAGMLSDKLEGTARSLGIHFETTVRGTAVFSNRDAGLVGLILENLIQNALEATPRGKVVRLTIAAGPEHVTMEVQDEGPGLPPEVRSRLFSPCASAKKGGSGIGLAISRQLASHLGATLELDRSSPLGCAFRLTLASASHLIEAEGRERAAALSSAVGAPKD